jgi:hypothetical protein
MQAANSCAGATGKATMDLLQSSNIIPGVACDKAGGVRKPVVAEGAVRRERLETAWPNCY